MAKKGAQVQLQVEITTEEDWDKLLEREGLIIVDIYSDWCGPCSAMSANLKKLKLEVGGDNLQLAMAKSDNIECLTRFRNKSEPTWMFIAGGKMVNLMFGANAPKLLRMITDELKKEESVRDGTRTRDETDILELSAVEKVRFEASEAIRIENEQVEQEAKMKAKLERLTIVVDNVLQTFPHHEVVVIFPYALDKISLLQEIWEPNGLKWTHIEKMSFKNINIEDMLYFTDYRFPELVQTLAEESPCTCYLIKTETEDSNIDDITLNAVYGTSQVPPGSPNSFALKMRTAVKKPKENAEESEKGSNKTNDKTSEKSGDKASDKHSEKESEKSQTSMEAEEEVDGIWVPPNAKTRALAIYMLFPGQALAHVPPEPEPIPPHIAIAYDAIKRTDVMALIEENGKEVMRFGFFSDDKPETAKLLAKTVAQFDKKTEETTYGERMVVQVSKKLSDTILAFAQLGPTYMSANAVEGEKDCNIFFPKGYDVPEVEEVEVLVKKRSKRRMKKAAAAPIADETAKDEKPKSPEDGEQKETFIEGEEAGEGTDFTPEMAEDDDGETLGDEEDGGEFGDDMPEEFDKATSPMTEEGTSSIHEVAPTEDQPANES